MTNETYTPSREGLVAPGLNKQQILMAVDTLIRNGSRNHIIDLDHEIRSKQQDEADQLRRLLEEMDSQSNHTRTLTMHPVQSGRMAYYDQESLDSPPWFEDSQTMPDVDERSVMVKIPVHTEPIHEAFEARVDRVYIFNLNPGMNQEVYDRTQKRLSKGIEQGDSSSLEELIARHDPRFLDQVSTEIAQYFLEKWSSGELRPELAFTEVSKVRNTPPSQ